MQPLHQTVEKRVARLAAMRPSGVAIQRNRVYFLLFVAAFALQQALLWYAYYAHGAKSLIGDEQAYQDTALSILHGGAWMPSTIWPPLQPLLLAALYALFGVHLVVVQVFQTLLLVGCALLLRDLWGQFGGGVRAANTAAALFVLNPSTAANAQWLWPELPHLILLLAAFCLLARAASRIAAGLAGASVGAALLAKSLLAAFWPAFLLIFVRRARPRFALASAALFLALLAMVTTPAVVHGWRSFGRPMIADSSIYNIWIGLTDRFRSDYVLDMGGATLPAFLASGPTPQARNAVYEEKVRALIADRGVIPLARAQLGRQYFRLFSAKTPLLSQLPGAACAGHLSVYRTSPLLTWLLTIGSDFFHILTLVAAAFGIACWRRRSALTMLVAMLFLAYQIALFALVHVKARFLLPMLPFLCGFAGSFLSATASRHRPLPATTIAMAQLRMTPLRIAFGATLAALLVFLAFAGPTLDHLCAG